MNNTPPEFYCACCSRIVQQKWDTCPECGVDGEWLTEDEFFDEGDSMTNTNVTQITDKQPQPACRFSITATLDGFPIEIQGEGKAADLKAIVDRLRAIGAMPPTAQGHPTKAGGTPTCPVHNAPMKASQKPGTFFCSKKNEDGSYCRHKA